MLLSKYTSLVRLLQKIIATTNAFQKLLDKFGHKPNKI